MYFEKLFKEQLKHLISNLMYRKAKKI